MSVYEWKPVYKLDIRRFDDQHRKLFGYMAELDTAMRQGKDALGGVLEPGIINFNIRALHHGREFQ